MTNGFVRAATSSDAQTMTTVALASWPHVGDAIEPAEMTQQWQSLLAQPTGITALVATDMDVVVGWLLLMADTQSATGEQTDTPGSVFEIADVVVHPHHRRRGHGSRLMNAAADIAFADGCTVRAWCPLDDETRRAFLIAHGLQPDGAWRDLVADSGDTIREVRLVAGVDARTNHEHSTEGTV